VATAALLTLLITVPGGTLPCGGVTRVTVLSTHRRRGLLTSMMRRQLDEMHERGEPLAALYASEAPIYGRFGYGLATYQADIELQRSHSALIERAAGGRLALVDMPTAIKAFVDVFERARGDQPGMISQHVGWVRTLLADLESRRQGASPHYRVVHYSDGSPTGFALYRIKMDWDASGPYGTLTLESLVAASAEAYAVLWHHVLGVDLIGRVTAHMRPVDEPLRFLLSDSRQPKTRIEDGLWLRLVDVGQALAGRRYAVEGRLVLHVRDLFCQWNDGHYELNGSPSSAECVRCSIDPDLELDVEDLAAVYLGGNGFRTLQTAGRIRELRRGAVAEADAMFATDRAPWCPSHF